MLLRPSLRPTGEGRHSGQQSRGRMGGQEWLPSPADKVQPLTVDATARRQANDIYKEGQRALYLYPHSHSHPFPSQASCTL